MTLGSRAALAIAVALAAQTIAAAQQAPAKDIRISMEEFRTLRQQDAVVVVDVRDVQSYAEGHIPGALSVPLDLLQQHVAKLKTLKKPIVTYCA